MSVLSRLTVLLFTVAALVVSNAAASKENVRSGGGATQRAVQTLKVAYLHRPTIPAVYFYFEPPAADAGLQGARLGIDDNNTTGRFTGHRFDLHEATLAEGDDPVAAFQSLSGQGYRYFLADLRAEEVERLAAARGAENSLIFDVASSDDRLRGTACSAQVKHVLPSRAMRADALAQWLAKKRWTKWFVVVGRGPGDAFYAEAIERAAKRFGGKVVARKNWVYEFDDRRTPESEVPVFTQGVDYDVLVVADEAGEFGDLLSYRTWLARPVVGTQGLVATAWHRTHEAWGALQLQKRFRERAGRGMSEVDYGAWLAVRSIGEAATRARSVELDAIKAFIGGADFALAGFKGVPLSFRPWDGQLRQPVLLAQERSLVGVAPIEGFIHPINELDTLGYDQSESDCKRVP